jgi:hypothetical protein
MIVALVLACLAVLLIGSAITDRVRRARRARRAAHDELTPRDLNQVAPGRDLDSVRADEINRIGSGVEGANTWQPNWPR